jgi:hypothetical protein
MIAATMVGSGEGGGFLSNYNFKKILPKLILVAVAVNTAFYICAALVDVSNITAVGANGLIAGIAGDPYVIEWGEAAAVAVGGVAIAVVAVLNFGAFILALLILLLLIILRNAVIILCVILSPVAFTLTVLPNTDKWFKKWFDTFFQMLIIYPAVMIIWSFMRLVASVMNSGVVGGGLFEDIIRSCMPLLIPLVPLLTLPAMMKTSGGLGGKLMGAVNGAINKSGVGQSLKKAGDDNGLAARLRNNPIKNRLEQGKALRNRNISMSNQKKLINSRKPELRAIGAAAVAKEQAQEQSDAESYIKNLNLTNDEMKALRENPGQEIRLSRGPMAGKALKGAGLSEAQQNALLGAAYYDGYKEIKGAGGNVTGGVNALEEEYGKAMAATGNGVNMSQAQRDAWEKKLKDNESLVPHLASAKNLALLRDGAAPTAETAMKDYIDSKPTAEELVNMKPDTLKQIAAYAGEYARENPDDEGIANLSKQAALIRDDPVGRYGGRNKDAATIGILAEIRHTPPDSDTGHIHGMEEESDSSDSYAPLSASPVYLNVRASAPAMPQQKLETARQAAGQKISGIIQKSRTEGRNLTESERKGIQTARDSRIALGEELNLRHRRDTREIAADGENHNNYDDNGRSPREEL